MRVQTYLRKFTQELLALINEAFRARCRAQNFNLPYSIIPPLDADILSPQRLEGEAIHANLTTPSEIQDKFYD